jgi:hypothetical protein
MATDLPLRQGDVALEIGPEKTSKQHHFRWVNNEPGWRFKQRHPLHRLELWRVNLGMEVDMGWLSLRG